MSSSANLICFSNKFLFDHAAVLWLGSLIHEFAQVMQAIIHAALLRLPCNTPTENSDQEYFTVTHCFHPFYKRRFRLVEYSRRWGEDKVGFFDDQKALSYLPARWTDRFPPDVFTVFSKGKAYFSIEALMELSALIKTLELARKDTADVK